MTDWSIWFVLAGVAIALELTTGTFYLLMIAIGFVAGGMAALSGVHLEWQLLSFAVIGIFGTIALRRSGLGGAGRKKASRDRNVVLDIGQTVQVAEWVEEGHIFSTQVKYRGAAWRAVLADRGNPVPGTFVIEEMRGNSLIVANTK